MAKKSILATERGSTKEGKQLLLHLYLFFHLLSPQSDTLNSLITNIFADSKAFSLSMIPSIGTYWLLFPTNQWKTLYLFGRSSHSVCFFVKKTFLSFPKKLSIYAYFSTMQKECFSGHRTLLPSPYSSFPFPSLLKLYILHLQTYCLTFVLWEPFFKNDWFEFTTLCLCFQKSIVRILVKNSNSIEKARRYRKSSSYREKFI